MRTILWSTILKVRSIFFAKIWEILIFEISRLQFVNFEFENLQFHVVRHPANARTNEAFWQTLCATDHYTCFV